MSVRNGLRRWFTRIVLFASYRRANDSILAERGHNLSQGQRQLLAFARVLAADPEILVLDEATANIDTATELIIQDALHRLTEGRTSIIIAHRLQTIQECDRVLVLHHGVVEGARHPRRAHRPRRHLPHPPRAPVSGRRSHRLPQRRGGGRRRRSAAEAAKGEPVSRRRALGPRRRTDRLGVVFARAGRGRGLGGERPGRRLVSHPQGPYQDALVALPLRIVAAEWSGAEGPVWLRLRHLQHGRQVRHLSVRRVMSLEEVVYSTLRR